MIAASSMNAFDTGSFPVADNRKAAQGGLCPVSCFGCSVAGDNQSDHGDLEMIAVRTIGRLHSVACTSQISFNDVEVIEAVHKVFLDCKRFEQITPRHLRNSPHASGNDRTTFAHLKMNLMTRCDVGSFRETRAHLSRCISSFFELLKINHLRRLQSEPVL